MDNDLKLAINASLKAGEIIMQYYCDDYEIKEKGYHNPVTTADKEADSYLKSTLMSARPEYGWLSEETVDSKNRLNKEKVWIVDPLDGTKEFIEGVPQFVVSIALVEKGIPIIGVLHNPVTKETFHAAKGEGAYLNQGQYRCSIKDSTRDMVILNSRSETRRGLWEPYKKHFKELRPIGSVAYKMGLTAIGKADIFATLRPKNEWDICAGTCLINEAGGKVINLNGKDITFNNQKTLIEPGLIAGYNLSVEKTYKIFNEK
ncbi:MAG: 3'(2'),5'-bisphosphate nucleotidase CysQ [Candidatus Neomarinimicrobiota bacterium]|nr:3'(2'),5'-bisphosphate nucleotidase CysQ [Candidatus Neomarinimicrobiota bacterium]